MRFHRLFKSALRSVALLGLLLGCSGQIDGGPVSRSLEFGSSRFPRLSHEQWENATRDLLRMPARPGLSAPWTAETTTGIFGNVGAELNVTGTLWDDYQVASETLAEQVAGDPDALMRILPDGLPTEPAARARAFIEGFGLRAYRRPLTMEQRTAFEASFAAAAPNFPGLDPFAAGVRQTIATMLQSPYFLYRSELSVAPAGSLEPTIPLDDYELASRLSFALWNSIPDDELFRAAGAGELSTDTGLRAQAERMLAMPAAGEMLQEFHRLLLGTVAYSQITRSDTVFPEYSPELRDSMVTEVERFVDDVIVQNDGGLRELLTSHHTFVDERLARVYGLSGVTGTDFRRVELDPTERSGILTMIGFLSANATSTETDPIHRGVFVGRRLICAELPAPPNNVPPLPPPSATPTTMRERVSEHTGPGTCGASCHGTIINPIGFAFERFDALGRVQDTERTTGLPIDTASAFRFDGMVQNYDGAIELADVMVASIQVHRCYAEHLTEYLFAERPVRRIVSARAGTISLDQNGSTRDLALAIVTDPLFRSRPSAPYDGPAPATEE